jgi:hypothetical protein
VIRKLSVEAGPALGDIRTMGRGDTVVLDPGVEGRMDWGRYLDALASALSRGVEVRWHRD